MEFIGEHLLSKKCDLPNKSKLHIVQLHAVPNSKKCWSFEKYIFQVDENSNAISW